MNRILILFAHPALERSRINVQLIKAVRDFPNVTFRDLYQIYPEFFINTQREQEQLLQHDLIIFQHPLYWYSVPPLLKQWIDLTLQHNWAYGDTGFFLKGKSLMNVTTTGGNQESYCSQGYNMYTIPEFLRPIEQTARLCQMHYLPPFVLHGTHQMKEAAIQEAYADYTNLLNVLSTAQLPLQPDKSVRYFNQLLKPSPTS